MCQKMYFWKNMEKDFPYLSQASMKGYLCQELVQHLSVVFLALIKIFLDTKPLLKQRKGNKIKASKNQPFLISKKPPLLFNKLQPSNNYRAFIQILNIDNYLYR